MAQKDEEQIQDSAQAPEVTPQGQGNETEEELILGKFKSYDDLEKSYKELEKKQGGFASTEKELEEYRQYIAQVQPVIAQIEQDEEVANLLRKKMGLIDDSGEKAEPSQTDVKVQEVERRLRQVEAKDRADVIESFEKKYGIDSLDSDRRKEVRAEIARRLEGWGRSVSQTNPSMLGNLLEDAYALVNNNEQIERARTEAIIKTKQNELGISGNTNSLQVNSGSSVSLTGDEKSAAQKMGISEKDYLDYKTQILRERGSIK